MKNTPLLVGVILLGSIGSLLAGPLQEAKINQIVNDVKVVDPQKGARPAAVQDTVRDQIAVRTGIQSRAELLFQDATLTRLGAETFFSFKAGTRDLTLERGTMLLQVPKNRGGARIRTASVTASITGTTIMLESLPGRSVKVLVLEGSLRLSLNGRFGESVKLTPGKMVIMGANAKKLPNPVDVDIRKVVKTSSLVDPTLFKGDSKANVAPLPSMALIEEAIAAQARQIAGNGLIPTNLVIAGNGSDVIAASEEVMAALDARVNGAGSATAQNVSNLVNAIGTGGGTSVSVSSGNVVQTIVNNTTGSLGTDSGTGAPGAVGGVGGTGGTVGGTVGETGGTVGGTVGETGGTVGGTVGETGGTVGGTVGETGGTVGGTVGGIGSGTPPTPPASFEVINIASVPTSVALSRPGTNGSFLSPAGTGGAVDLRGPNLEVDTNKIDGIYLIGGNGALGLAPQGGDGGYLRAGTQSAPLSGKIDILAPVVATSGVNSTGAVFGGAGGTVELVADGEITVKSLVKVSNGASASASRSGGNIFIEGRRSGSAIKIENSAQLLSLLDAAAPGPGGTITIRATQGDVSVKDSTVRADRGLVDIAAGGSGKIVLDNATVRGDTVRIGALGANGQLEIGRGSINADTTMKLYGGMTNGQVHFKDDVTLGGAGVKHIAGAAVTIDNGKTVTIGGSAPANVYTNNPNYTGSGGNGSKSGTFGGQGAVTQPLGNRPSF